MVTTGQSRGRRRVYLEAGDGVGPGHTDRRPPARAPTPASLCALLRACGQPGGVSSDPTLKAQAGLGPTGLSAPLTQEHCLQVTQEQNSAMRTNQTRWLTSGGWAHSGGGGAWQRTHLHHVSGVTCPQMESQHQVVKT